MSQPHANGSGRKHHVVRPWLTVRTGLYAHRDDIAEHGQPSSAKDLAEHTFIGGDEGAVSLPFLAWLKTVIKPCTEAPTCKRS